MKERTYCNLDVKRILVGAVLSFIIITTLTARIVSARMSLDNENIKDSFFERANYDPEKGILSFTIPNSIPEGSRFYLHISGRIFMGDKPGGMSFHVFDKESLDSAWEKGKTYTYPLKSENLDFILLDFGLINENDNKLAFEYTIHIFSDGTKTIAKEDRFNVGK